jgi:multidrug efflux system membrane fusion protein
MDQPTSVSHVPPASQPAGDSPSPVKKRRHWWVWVLVLLAFGLTFYWVITHQQHSEAATRAGGGGRRMVGGVVPVTTATARSGSVGIYQDAIGTVTPLYTVSINAQVTGLITEVHYREGQMVKKGDPLIDIDCRQYEAQLAHAQGTLERDQCASPGGNGLGTL